MRKIISLFQRNYDGDYLVRDELVPGAEWVAAGEGVATRKYDGTSCLIRDGVLYKRYDARQGRQPPPGFEPAQEPDPVTGHWPGWLPVGGDTVDRWHREAFARGVDACGLPFADGTYELVGPKVQGNPEGVSEHVLVRHGADVLHNAPRTFAELRAYLEPLAIEGLVWHHPDGRMVKVKRGDFFGKPRGRNR
jgi:hypothetical protein